MKKFNINSGITLIALVITIIVMLILVAIVLQLAINGGLFGYASNATLETKEAMDYEKNLGDLRDNLTTNELIDHFTTSNGTDNDDDSGDEPPALPFGPLQPSTTITLVFNDTGVQYRTTFNVNLLTTWSVYIGSDGLRQTGDLIFTCDTIAGGGTPVRVATSDNSHSGNIILNSSYVYPGDSMQQTTYYVANTLSGGTGNQGQ